MGNINTPSIGVYIGFPYLLVINVLAYVDDLVLCAPTWQAVQHLINLLAKQDAVLQLTVNLCKTVCMVFPPKDKTKIISKILPPLKLDGKELQFVLCSSNTWDTYFCII